MFWSPADKNLRYQQNLVRAAKIAILVLPTNKLKILKRIVPRYPRDSLIR